MGPQRLLLDTDIGTDVDDCLALGLILASPELALEGVTVVYGNVALRARIVLKLLQLRGIFDLPVAIGASAPLESSRPVYWAGHEGAGLLNPDDEPLVPIRESAVDFITHAVMASPGDIVLVAIGPLTNIALAFQREPQLASNLAGLCVMGGVIGGLGALDLPWSEYNFRSDPEAAQIVLASGAPLTLVPLDVTTRVRITPEGVTRIRAAGDPFHAAVARQIELYPRFAARGWTHLHDPLAVSALIRPSLVTCETLHAVVETKGEYSAGRLLVRRPDLAHVQTAKVAVGVDVRRSEEFIISRLT